MPIVVPQVQHDPAKADLAYVNEALQNYLYNNPDAVQNTIPQWGEDGLSLTNGIPAVAVRSVQSDNYPNSITQRDANGDVWANKFQGDGSALWGIKVSQVDNAVSALNFTNHLNDLTAHGLANKINTLTGTAGTVAVSDGCGQLSLRSAASISAAGVITLPNFVSSVATGTQPYAATSTTKNTNLNADLLDGVHMPSITQGALLYGSATDQLATLGKDNCGKKFLTNCGTNNNPSWLALSVTTGSVVSSVSSCNASVVTSVSASTANAVTSINFSNQTYGTGCFVTGVSYCCSSVVGSLSTNSATVVTAVS